MSALRMRSLRALNSRTSGATRSFQTSRIALAGKESSLHEDQNDRAARIEKAKQDQQKDSAANQGKWRDELASDSESIVKADRGDIKDTKSTIKELQDETAKLAQQDKKDGKN